MNLTLLESRFGHPSFKSSSEAESVPKVLVFSGLMLEMGPHTTNQNITGNSQNGTSMFSN